MLDLEIKRGNHRLVPKVAIRGLLDCLSPSGWSTDRSGSLRTFMQEDPFFYVADSLRHSEDGISVKQ